MCKNASNCAKMWREGIMTAFFLCCHLCILTKSPPQRQPFLAPDHGSNCGSPGHSSEPPEPNFATDIWRETLNVLSI